MAIATCRRTRKPQRRYRDPTPKCALGSGEGVALWWRLCYVLQELGSSRQEIEQFKLLSLGELIVLVRERLADLYVSLGKV